MNIYLGIGFGFIAGLLVAARFPKMVMPLRRLLSGPDPWPPQDPGREAMNKQR